MVPTNEDRQKFNKLIVHIHETFLCSHGQWALHLQYIGFRLQPKAYAAKASSAATSARISPAGVHHPSTVSKKFVKVNQHVKQVCLRAHCKKASPLSPEGLTPTGIYRRQLSGFKKYVHKQTFRAGSCSRAAPCPHDCPHKDWEKAFIKKDALS